MSRAVSYEVVDGVQAPWLRRRFGDHYAQISSQTTMKLRSSAKDVARALRGHVPPEIEELTKKFAEPPQGITDHDFVFGYESPEGHVAGSLETDEALGEYVRRFPEDWKITQKCLGQVRQSTRHPCHPVGEQVLIYDPSAPGGVSKEAIELCDGKTVLTGQGATATVKLLDQGIQEVMEYTLDNGEILRCTPQHRLLTTLGWRSAQEVFDRGLDLVSAASCQGTLSPTSRTSPEKKEESA